MVAPTESISSSLPLRSRRGRPKHPLSGKGAPSTGLNFISVDPSNPTDDAASRTIIRANAGRYIWKRRKEKSENMQGSSFYKRSTGTYSRSESSPSSDEDARQVSENANRRQIARRMRPHSFAADPLAGVDYGLCSPFIVPQSSFSKDQIRKLVKYGGSVIMRKLVPPKKNNPAHATNHYIWVASAMRNPALLSAYVYGNLTHELAFRWMRGELTPEYKRQLMMQIMVAELEAINRISEALADPQQRFSEELTLAIFLMGYSYVSERQLPSDRSQHMSPLRDLQWASVYSVLEYNTTHVNGLMQLISLRGGLDAIKMPGLVEMLSLGAIMFATKSLTKPMCPYIPLNKTNGKHVQPDWPPSIQSLLDSSGDSGSHPSNLLGVGIPVDAISLLQDMRSFSRVVEFFMKGIMTIETSESELSFIADRRNWIQHKALSLPPASELPPSEFTPIYEPLRYAMISYSILVVFTVLPSLAPFPRLSRLIKQAIIDYPVRKEWDLQMMHVLVWILVIGGIISSDEETGTWFAGLLGVVSSTIGINSWADLIVILASVVWVDHDEGLDPRARAFWDKVVSLQHGAFDHMGSGSRL